MLITQDGMPGMGVLKALIEKRPSPEKIKAAADIHGRLIIKPGKSWKKPHVKALLSEMASNVYASGEDEFVIETKGGLRLTKKKMSVHKSYEVYGDKQLLNPQDCQTKLLGVLNNLRDAGLLE